MPTVITTPPTPDAVARLLRLIEMHRALLDEIAACAAPLDDVLLADIAGLVRRGVDVLGHIAENHALAAPLPQDGRRRHSIDEKCPR
jgi:hypothetical protein